MFVCACIQFEMLSAVDKDVDIIIIIMIMMMMVIDLRKSTHTHTHTVINDVGHLFSTHF